MVGPLIGAQRRDGAAGPARSADATDGPDRPRAVSTNSSTARPGSWLLRPLETRFPVRRQAPTDQVTGIVLLEGFHLDSRVASELNSHVASELDSRAASERFDIRSGIAERVMETVRLSKLYPEARILYSGGGMEAKLGKKFSCGWALSAKESSWKIDPETRLKMQDYQR